mmetsp:Transcript_7293/g.13457  ORF Transcript_7293/g.13457 Transcript_7293/m.13457 type:complete len:381 (-) Transcript_7293:39-1181(-)
MPRKRVLVRARASVGVEVVTHDEVVHEGRGCHCLVNLVAEARLVVGSGITVREAVARPGPLRHEHILEEAQLLLSCVGRDPRRARALELSLLEVQLRVSVVVVAVNRQVHVVQRARVQLKAHGADHHHHRALAHVTTSPQIIGWIACDTIAAFLVDHGHEILALRVGVVVHDGASVVTAKLVRVRILCSAAGKPYLRCRVVRGTVGAALCTLPTEIQLVGVLPVAREALIRLHRRILADHLHIHRARRAHKPRLSVIPVSEAVRVSAARLVQAVSRAVVDHAVPKVRLSVRVLQATLLHVADGIFDVSEVHRWQELTEIAHHVTLFLGGLIDRLHDGVEDGAVRGVDIGLVGRHNTRPPVRLVHRLRYLLAVGAHEQGAL